MMSYVIRYCTRKAYKDFGVKGLTNKGRIVITLHIKNIIVRSKSRAQRYAHVPPVAEHMSIQWLYEY
jgi:hypothetical protein